MAYSGVQMFMDKLNQLINCNHIPSINNPEIIRERPQFQLLYEELDNPVIQTLFIHQHQDLEKVNDLKKRFTDAAEEAQYIVDLFLSRVLDKNNGYFTTSEDDGRRSLKSVVNLFLPCVHIKKNDVSSPTSDDFNPSLNLDGVMRSFNLVKVELTSINIGSIKTDPSPRPERMLNQSADPIPFTTKPQGSNIVMGLDDDAGLIRDKLVEDQKKVDVVSIVGMGGIGKTTLANKVFNDRFVMYHFHVRVWVTVSQTYHKRDVLIQIMESICGQLHLQKATDSELREMVHKHLMGRRYLIVIDDIWHTETWDNLKVFFPHDNNGSRILLTTRLNEVAKHANSDGFIHHLGYLSKKQSWELLCEKVFHGNEYPEWSIKLGMQIVENCHGLPLAVLVIAGVLAKEARSKKFWAEIAERTGSYIVGDQNRCMETIAFSYNHLPQHLRECFLYLGGFPEDYEFEVHRLIWLWVAEGFIQQDGNRSLEDIAEDYLMDLIDRHLVIVADRSKYNGVVLLCKLHDLVRELCLKKSKEERFILQTERLLLSSQFSNVLKPPYKPVRMFLNEAIHHRHSAHLHSGKLRSLLCFRLFRFLNDDIAKYFRSFVLLRVLDLEQCSLDYFPKGMDLLVHLRYLAICISSGDFPSSICNLWNLQTLIYIPSIDRYFIVLPSNISDLVNLRHLHVNRFYNRRGFYLPSIENPMNLQTISVMELRDGLDKFQKCFPYIKELKCNTYKDEDYDFKSLIYLEKLEVFSRRRRMQWTVHDVPKGCGKNQITFPATLKALTLVESCLPWSGMSSIQSLPNLEVLILMDDAFKGNCWNTEGQEFPQLKLLRLWGLDIKQWETYSTSFPCLRELEIIWCYHLEEIPLEIGDIPTLELIKILNCRHSVSVSVRRIQEEQNDSGNNLKIDISELP